MARAKRKWAEKWPPSQESLESLLDRLALCVLECVCLLGVFCCSGGNNMIHVYLILSPFFLVLNVLVRDNQYYYWMFSPPATLGGGGVLCVAPCLIYSGVRSFAAF